METKHQGQGLTESTEALVGMAVKPVSFGKWTQGEHVAIRRHSSRNQESLPKVFGKVEAQMNLGIDWSPRVFRNAEMFSYS